MAVDALCPMCGAVFSLRDDMEGKKVRCTKCEQIFTVGGAKAKAAAAKDSVQSRPAGPAKKAAREDAEDEVSTARKTRAAARRGRDDDEDDEDDRPRKGAARRGKDDDDDDEDDKPKAKAKKRTYHNDDDDDDDDAPRKPAKKKSGGGVGLILGIVGGAVFVLLLLCGGGIYWFVHTANAVIDDANDQIANAQQNVNNGNPPPGFPNLGDPRNPMQPQKPPLATIDDALRDLKSNNDNERKAALDWLARANLDNARQGEVSRAINPILKEADNGIREKAVIALKVWVMKDNLDGLIQILNEGNPERWHHENGLPRVTMEVVAKLHEEKAAEPIWRYRAGWSGNEAETALRALGQAAGEKAALLRFDDANENLRNSARSLLVSYGTRDPVKFKQVAADLQDNDRNRRNAAFSYLATAAVVESERQTVGPAMNASLQTSEISNDAMTAVEKWATADNVPALLKVIDDDRFPHRKRAMMVLGKLHDGRAIEPLAAKLVGGERRDAADALIAYGKDAKSVVERYATNSDKGVQREVDRVLASYGSDTSGLGMARLLADLESPDGGRRSAAVQSLTLMKPDAKEQTKVIKALEKVAAEDVDKGIQERAIKALLPWGSKADAEPLIKIIGDKEKYAANVRHTAMDTLAKWKAEEAVRAIALNIGPDRGDRDAASKALVLMGADLGDKIEVVVKDGLRSTDKAVVLECVKILGAVGTKASIAPLTKLNNAALVQKQRDVVAACTTAVANIEARGK